MHERHDTNGSRRKQGESGCRVDGVEKSRCDSLHIGCPLSVVIAIGYLDGSETTWFVNLSVR